MWCARLLAFACVCWALSGPFGVVWVCAEVVWFARSRRTKHNKTSEPTTHTKTMQAGCVDVSVDCCRVRSVVLTHFGCRCLIHYDPPVVDLVVGIERSGTLAFCSDQTSHVGPVLSPHCDCFVLQVLSSFFVPRRSLVARLWNARVLEHTETKGRDP